MFSLQILNFKVSVESPRGLRAVLKEVYTSPPISEPDFYHPKPPPEDENELSLTEKKPEEKGKCHQRRLFYVYATPRILK